MIPSYLYNGYSYTGETTYLHWDGAQVLWHPTVLVDYQGHYWQQSRFVLLQGCVACKDLFIICFRVIRRQMFVKISQVLVTKFDDMAEAMSNYYCRVKPFLWHCTPIFVEVISTNKTRYSNCVYPWKCIDNMIQSKGFTRNDSIQNAGFQCQWSRDC